MTFARNSTGTLLDILKHRRPHGSKTEVQFCEQFIETLPNINQDGFGNYWLSIGSEPTTLWSCHTDTVSREGGMQNVKWDKNTLRLHEGKPGQSLGADDGAGLWLMLEMIKANKPGLYVFHRAEEVGGQGSEWVARHNPNLLHGIKRAIAFDRKGTDSVITMQRWQRTASDKFARALCTELNKHKGFSYKPDPTGVFTDTANYDGIVPECTNLSVGYENEHGPRESLDVHHLLKLRTAVLAIDFEALPTERDPNVIEYDDWRGFSPYGSWEPVRSTSLEDVVRTRPVAVARWLESRGVLVEDLEDILDDVMNKPADTVEYLFCNLCGSTNTVKYQRDICPECGSFDIEVV